MPIYPFRFCLLSARIAPCQKPDQTPIPLPWKYGSPEYWLAQPFGTIFDGEQKCFVAGAEIKYNRVSVRALTKK